MALFHYLIDVCRLVFNVAPSLRTYSKKDSFKFYAQLEKKEELLAWVIRKTNSSFWKTAVLFVNEDSGHDKKCSRAPVPRKKTKEIISAFRESRNVENETSTLHLDMHSVPISA